MKKLHCFLAVGIAVCSFTGCGVEQHPSYSENVRYGVRTDPILMTQGADLGEDRFDPDRPGVFPLMKFADIKMPENPIYPKSSKIDDTILRDPTAFSDKLRRKIEKLLEEQFGTPARPTIRADVAGIDQATIDDLKLDDKTLRTGSTRYRVHCLHCHGVPGDGRGPTARWINPHPRDFRAGMFKFQSIDQATDGKERPPARADLLRTLRHGIEGTAMPTFNLLADEELEALVSYVIHLSLRGNAEMKLFKDYYTRDSDGSFVWNGGPGEQPLEEPEAVSSITEKNVKKWSASNDPANAIKVAAYPYKDGDLEQLKKSVQRGQYLFTNDKAKYDRADKANCKQCHDDYGRQARFKFDGWGTLVRPNNFTQGVFRGGRRPVDLYYRIHSGINGSGMTNFGNADRNLKSDEIWDLVNFVQVLSQPAMQKKLGISID